MKGELMVGGVYVRLFIKEPTFPLRDPRGFLEALLRRFQREAEHLVGLTSDDADKRRAAERAAKEEAELEERQGGHATSNNKGGGDEGGSLVVRGEDVLTKVTNAIVCMLRARKSMADQVSSLGYVPKFISMLRQSIGKPGRYNLMIQTVRLVEVLAPSRVCCQSMGRAQVCGLIVRSIKPEPHRDASFAVETIRRLLEHDAKGLAGPDHPHALSALNEGVIPLMLDILEKFKLENVVNSGTCKVHAVEVIKVLERDTVHGERVAAQLSARSGEWGKYKHQKHDLFISKNDTRDYFLTDADTGPSTRLLKNVAAN